MILVTGGLGMIGAHTARALVDLGHEVVVTTHHRTEVPSFLAGRVTVGLLDVTDRDAFLALADRHDISDIVHLAGSIPDQDPVAFFVSEGRRLLLVGRVRAVLPRSGRPRLSSAASVCRQDDRDRRPEERAADRHAGGRRSSPGARRGAAEAKEASA